MSSKSTRKYDQKLRAEQQEETKLRITVAAMDLHGSVGPAKTTISAVADRAGVQRATVYRYFPDDAALFEACSTHWLMENPPPDPTTWLAIKDPSERLHAALTDMYSHYERTEQMMANIIRDESLHPAVPPLIASYWGFLEIATDAMLEGGGLRGRAKAKRRAAIRLALDFRTWQSLARDAGLKRVEAVDVMLTAGS